MPEFLNWEIKSSNCFERVPTFVPYPVTVDHKLYMDCLYTRNRWRRYDWFSNVVKPYVARMSSSYFVPNMRRDETLYGRIRRVFVPFCAGPNVVRPLRRAIAPRFYGTGRSALGISPVPIEREFTREFPTWIHAQLKSWSRLQLVLFVRPSSVVQTSCGGGWTVRQRTYIEDYFMTN
jgi:hypothetical protein